VIQKKNIKEYVFNRDKGICYHCGKPVRFNKMTLDHYFPKSLGGAEAYYNLVCSCKTCNRLKKSVVPKDWMTVNIELFKCAVVDGKITKASDVYIVQNQLVALTQKIETIFRNKVNTVFEGPGFRLYVKDNRIYKMVKFHQMEADSNFEPEFE